jgi:hypothetical protein
MPSKRCTENLKENYLLEELGADGRVILKLILQKWGGKVWTGFI